MSHEIIRELAEGTSECALVTVIRTEGSVPRHAGAKMLVRRDGSTRGTVGGGRPEVIAVERALQVIGGHGCDLISVDMHGTEAEGDALVCGGTSVMIVEDLHDTSPYRVARDLLVAGKRALLVKRLPSDPDRTCATAVMDAAGLTVHPGGFDPDPGRVTRALQGGKTVFDQAASLLYDPQLPEEKLLILGAGHVGRAVAAIAAGLGFAVTVADDRPALSDNRGLFPPGVRVRSGDYSAIVRDFPWDPASYVVIMTRGHLFDLECLRAVLPQTWRYAGLIGSSRKTALLMGQVRRDGFDPARVDAVHAPIGLDIGAETPEEIAVSVLAEMIAIRRRDGACSMLPLSRHGDHVS